MTAILSHYTSSLVANVGTNSWTLGFGMVGKLFVDDKHDTGYKECAAAWRTL